MDKFLQETYARPLLKKEDHPFMKNMPGDVVHVLPWKDKTAGTGMPVD
jgi:hypothetical protein